MKVTNCTGEGQGSCKRCSDNGKWNRTWMCFLYKIEGYEGCYCETCVNEIQSKAISDTFCSDKQNHLVHCEECHTGDCESKELRE